MKIGAFLLGRLDMGRHAKASIRENKKSSSSGYKPTKPSVNIIPFKKSGGAFLFHLVSKLYEKMSIIITTNLEFSEWAGVFCLASITLSGLTTIMMAG